MTTVLGVASGAAAVRLKDGESCLAEATGGFFVPAAVGLNPVHVEDAAATGLGGPEAGVCFVTVGESDCDFFKRRHDLAMLTGS